VCSSDLSVEPDGVRWAAGALGRVAVILWATGFRPAVAHLAPLGLRGPRGGIALDGTTVVADRRVQLVGYGPSAGAIGANRGGRLAATRVRADRGRGGRCLVGVTDSAQEPPVPAAKIASSSARPGRSTGSTSPSGPASRT